MVDLSGLFDLIPAEILSTVKVFRSTESSGDGGVPVHLWTEVLELQMQIEAITEGQAQRAFGLQTDSKWRAVVKPGVDIKIDDLLQPQHGPYAGENMLVNDDREPLKGGLRIIRATDTDEVPP